MTHGWECKYFMGGGGLCTKIWGHNGPHYAGAKRYQKAAMGNLLSAQTHDPITPEATSEMLTTAQRPLGEAVWICAPRFVPRTSDDWEVAWAAFFADSATKPRVTR